MSQTTTTNDMRRANILAQAMAGAISLEDATQQLAALERTATASAQSQQRVSMKVSQKGALSIYGLGRWPVTLYAAQWERLLAASKEIREFLQANEAELARK